MMGCVRGSCMNHPVVLVSDSDAGFVTALGKQAALVGLWVVPGSSSDVFQLARELRPEVVVLDVERQANGCQLLGSLRSIPELNDSTVIASSGKQDERLREECLRLGATEYLVKPFDTQAITRLAKFAGDIRRQRMRNVATEG